MNVTVIVNAVSYIGGTGSHVKKGKEKISLDKGVPHYIQLTIVPIQYSSFPYTVIGAESGSMTLPVSASNYLGSLKDQTLLSVTVLAVVEETRQSWVSKVPYRLHTPDLSFTVDGKEGIYRHT